ncbi:MAG: phosphate signaling complex protein PhoU [Phycisphaerales bacterium]|nr:phosphate signaling complex protein PhoU [Phycisphaerales bacterium]
MTETVQMQDPAEAGGVARPRSGFEREVVQLKRRLVREATLAIAMLQEALEALWKLDRTMAADLKARDNAIDDEEVAIEQACFELLALQQPVARDFRIIAFILRVNSDLERVADHACSIAKVGAKIEGDQPPRWPVSLLELGERVPYMCQRLLRAVLDEDAEAARQIVAEDETIDALHKQLFKETIEYMRREPASEANGLHIARLGRELERVGDLMANIAEDVVYLVTGSIVRHEKHAAKRNGASAPPQA